jgi:molybdopterin molybdotransferase
MRGFQDRAPLTEALALLDTRLSPLPAENVPLREAAGRVLATDVIAGVAVPPFDRAAMDGYALRANETAAASDDNRLEFAIIGTSLPGRPFLGTVGSGQTVRIMTGAPLPAGADAIVVVEAAEELAGGSRVLIRAAVVAGRHIGRLGEDITAGSMVFSAGRMLRPQDIGVLASIGCGLVPVIRQPVVSILVTGDELLPAGSKPEGFRIVDSNSIMLAALVRRDVGLAKEPVLVPDRREAVREALMAATGDIVVITGGTSVGEEDHVPGVVAEAGELLVHGVAIRPAGPSGFGILAGAKPRLVFLLPGNPVACLAGYDFFAGRAVRRQGGRSAEFPHRRTILPLACPLLSAPDRADYVRVVVRDSQVEPLPGGGASILSSATRADGFVIVPTEILAYAPGESVEVFLYE